MKKDIDWTKVVAIVSPVCTAIMVVACIVVSGQSSSVAKADAYEEGCGSSGTQAMYVCLLQRDTRAIRDELRDLNLKLIEAHGEQKVLNVEIQQLTKVLETGFGSTNRTLQDISRHQANCNR